MKKTGKYYLVRPKKSMNEEKDTESRLNDENPMYRARIMPKDAKERIGNEESNLKSIYPVSYLPNFFFMNTVSHPFLIFHNLNKKFEETANGQVFSEREGKEKPIMDQLNEFFDANVLSFAQLKTELNKVADTWHKRFPYSKSNTFHPVHDDFKVIDISDLQSLHLLGFSLNTGIYLLFYIDEILYNMKLGPDNSENDIHFQVFSNVNKELIFDNDENTEKNAGNGENDNKVYRQEKWLSFQIIEVGKIFDRELNFNPFDSDNNLLYLEMERRDPIPIIKLPELEESDFLEITLQKKIDQKKIPKILFQMNNENEKDIQKKKDNEKIPDLGIEITISNSDQERMLNKFKSLVTKLEVNKDMKVNKDSINNIDITLIAETNDSAFLVEETNLESQQKMKEYAFQIGKPISKEQIAQNIISFNDRVKLQYTYSYLIDEKTGKSKHPLINLLCVNQLTDVMLLGTDYIYNHLDIKKNPYNELKLRLVPVENDDIYYSFRKYDQNKENWRKITDNYPSILSIGQNHSYDDKVQSKRRYNNDEPKSFQDFYFFVTKMPSKLRNEFKKLNSRSKKLIDYYMKSDIGLNPIFCPVILKEYNELSRASCILYYSNEHYDNPINSILLRDVQSVKEVKSRTTIDLFDEESVNENVRRGNYPVKIQTLLTRIKMKGNQRIPDPSFAFKKSFSFQNDVDVLQLKDLRKPEYEYKFYGVYNGKIINTSKFTISSHYKLSYLYVSQDNVFSIGQFDLSSNNKFVYGHCNTIDTEMIFDSPHIGSFKTAIYMENYKCLIIVYQIENNKSNSILFTGYDEQGQINDVEFNIIDQNDKEVIDFKFDSLATLSRSYFTAQFTVIRKNNKKTKKENKQEETIVKYNYSVFKYDSRKRTIIKCDNNELWRVEENSFCKAFLKEKEENPMCFIGSRLDSSYENSSTLCIYKYENDNLIPIYSNEDSSFDSNFILDEDENDETIDYDIRLLENRIKERKSQKNSKTNVNKTMISSMLNCVDIETKEKFTVFDFHCSLCELFPSPLVINDHLVCCSNSSLSFYRCDYKIYRLISHQISCFFMNTFQRMSLFTTEMLLCRYNFNRIQVAIIVDTCGIGARVSNLLFGTRFDENQIIDNEIWSGFSYSKDTAFIILLFHVKDIKNIFNAIQTRQQINNEKFLNPFIFVCSNNGAKNSIKFGINPKSICTTTSSKAENVINLLSFVNNNELEEKIVDLYKSIHDHDELKKNKCLFYNNSNDALVFAKEIVTQYLSFGTFVNYPHKTIVKYSVNIFNKAENVAKHSKVVTLDYFTIQNTEK